MYNLISKYITNTIYYMNIAYRFRTHDRGNIYIIYIYNILCEKFKNL